MFPLTLETLDMMNIAVITAFEIYIAILALNSRSPDGKLSLDDYEASVSLRARNGSHE